MNCVDDASTTVSTRQGVNIVAASLITFGTPEQQQHWALPVLRAEMTASLGMSEPSAGSDLASLRKRAVRDGDVFIVNGQKVWTSGAHDADFLLAFVRTDPDAPKHKGISALIIPTKTEGVVCRPFPDVANQDNLDFNEVFLTDVRVPAENLVGGLHQGWMVANGSLGHERTMMWLMLADRIDNLMADCRPRNDVERDRFASTIIDTTPFGRWDQQHWVVPRAENRTPRALFPCLNFSALKRRCAQRTSH